MLDTVIRSAPFVPLTTTASCSPSPRAEPPAPRFTSTPMTSVVDRSLTMTVSGPPRVTKLTVLDVVDVQRRPHVPDNGQSPLAGGHLDRFAAVGPPENQGVGPFAAFEHVVAVAGVPDEAGLRQCPRTRSRCRRCHRSRHCHRRRPARRLPAYRGGCRCRRGPRHGRSPGSEAYSRRWCRPRRCR